MSAFDLKQSKKKRLEDVWNSYYKKVLVMVVSGKNIPEKVEAAVSIRLGDKKYKAISKKQEAEPNFGDTFYL